MAEPDDVELPPAYDFSVGLPGFTTTPPATPRIPPAAPVPPVVASPSTPPPATPPTPPPSTTPDPSPGQVPPGRPPKRRNRRSSGPALYGTPPGVTAPGGTPPASTRRRGAAAPTTSAGPTGTTSPTPPPSRPSPPPPRKQRPYRLVGAAVGVTVAVVLVANNVGNEGGSGGVALPELPSTGSVLWSHDVESAALLVDDGMDGSTDYAVPDDALLAVGDRVVGRFTEDPWDETTPATVRAFDLADGDASDLVTMDRPRCVAVPEDLGRGGGLLACAGGIGGTTAMVTLDVATGAEVERFPLRSPVDLMTATTDGYVVLDRVDGETGATALRWYAADGTQRWSDDLEDLPDAVREEIVHQRDDGWRLAYTTELVAVGDGAALVAGSALAVVDESGVTASGDCRWGTVLAGSAVCSDLETGVTRGIAPSGALLWESEDVDLRSTLRTRAPILLTQEYLDNSFTDRSYRILDPVTGRAGPEILRGPDPVDVDGTAAVPVLTARPGSATSDEVATTEVSVLDPATGTIAWTTPVETERHPRVLVTEDRVLVARTFREWVVLDVRTGDVLGLLTGSGSFAAVVPGGALVHELFEIRRVDLG
ncbi:hypothetical protein C8046_09810 [Serinibacter arcticus]|uniref:Uncharacterized protein n=1 Tax=Serinibacter arcticus TaxID=1655435 RepID=A0A2U1ZVB0_9MICO|nr:PQQ-binding-like beta-propeller repeat protein [Serinibacter arcticus]PWD50904.1 hypothetical protein C8046_09810 [Serinibacter arcticus]